MCAANFAVCACTLFTGKQEYIKVKICIIWSNMKIMMSLQLSDWRSVNYLKWHFIKSDTKKTLPLLRFIRLTDESNGSIRAAKMVRWSHSHVVKTLSDSLGTSLQPLVCQNGASPGRQNTHLALGVASARALPFKNFRGKNCLNKHV